MDIKNLLGKRARLAWKRNVKTPAKRAWLQATGRPVEIVESIAGTIGGPVAVDFDFPSRSEAGEPAQLASGLCRQEQLTSPAFKHWLELYGLSTTRMHRKLWELAYVTQALHERGCLEPGKRGLGFAVGEEPLPAYFAERGVELLATDLDADDHRAQDWRKTGQHLSNLSDAGVTTTDAGGRLERRSVDMNKIPDDLRNYDFTWSTCSFEHCGSIELGLAFLRNQMKCLRPGGLAVHTTEFNLTSNDATLTEGKTVIFRRRDMERVADELRAEGHHVETISYDPGDKPFDRHIDWPPFSNDQHLRLNLGRYAATSIGLIIRKSAAESARDAA